MYLREKTEKGSCNNKVQIFGKTKSYRMHLRNETNL